MVEEQIRKNIYKSIVRRNNESPMSIIQRSF